MILGEKSRASFADAMPSVFDARNAVFVKGHGASGAVERSEDTIVPRSERDKAGNRDGEQPGRGAEAEHDKRRQCERRNRGKPGVADPRVKTREARMFGGTGRPSVLICLERWIRQNAEACPAILSERVANAEFQVRTAFDADFHLKGHAGVVPRADHKVESGLCVGIADICVVKIDRWSASDIGVPPALSRERIRELEIAPHHSDVTADPDIDARTKSQPADQRSRFNVRSEVELIGIERQTGVSAGRHLRHRRRCECTRHSETRHTHPHANTTHT
jgi:hypothetical protein